MKRIISTLSLICLLASVCLAQIKVISNPQSNKSVNIAQWEVCDLVYKVKKKVDKPFTTEVNAIVKGLDGVQKVPLFFNGDGEWVFRFSSAQTGEKSFVIESDIKELNGKKGRFTITANTKKDRHGGVVLNKEIPNRFFYEDGSHYFNLAFECDWLYALDYGQNDLAKTKHLLSLIKENGYNQVVMNVYAYGLDLDWVKDERLDNYPQHNYGEREDIFPFLGSNSNPDYSSLNIDFFKHLDKVIAELHNNEIVSHLMIYVWNKRVAWPKAGSEADNMYYKHVIKRYQAFPNVIWDVSKEAISPIAKSQNANIEEHVAERSKLTREMDVFDRLVSVHDFGFCKRHKDLVDFISIQNWKLDIYGDMLKAYNDFPEKPVFCIEHGGYEASPYNIFPGGYANAEACLKRNYMCLFAGTYTTYYWQATAWNAIIHNPFEQPDNFIKPHFEYFKYMRNLFTNLNYENFVPVTKFNSRSFNLTNYQEGQILLYVPKEVYYANVQTQVEKEFNGEEATIQWFNTVTGEYSKEEKLVFQHKYGFWDWRPWRDEADVIMIVKGLKQKN